MPSLRLPALCCALVAAALLAAGGAAAIDGLAPPGPCAQDESSVAGPVRRLFSPQDVASDGGSAAETGGLPDAPAFDVSDACALAGCGDTIVVPPTNPPGPGKPPGPKQLP